LRGGLWRWRRLGEALQMSAPRALALCRVQRMPGEQDLRLPDVVEFLGEIPNMPGHAVVADPDSGRIHSGWHVERFTELGEAEI
jgi:hypothetical protein